VQRRGRRERRSHHAHRVEEVTGRIRGSRHACDPRMPPRQPPSQSRCRLPADEAATISILSGEATAMNPLPFASLSFRFPRGPLALGIALACTPALAVEAPADSDDGDRLDTIVVTAGGYEQLIADAPASISVISREELEVRPFVDLQDALRGVEGVSLTGSNVNRTDIQLRGMPGNYTLILVDGLRQSTRENSSREDIGATQAAQIPPLEAVERIEIVRGPMSSLYGSDAIGGVVNIITRKPDAEWTGALNLDTTVQEHSDLGNRRGGNFYIGGPFAADRARLQVY